MGDEVVEIFIPEMKANSFKLSDSNKKLISVSTLVENSSNLRIPHYSSVQVYTDFEHDENSK